MFKPLPGLVLGLLTVSVLTGCGPDAVAPAAGHTLIFGSFYGECRGESCIELYRLDLSRQSLAEDVADKYPSFDSPYNGRYAARDAAAYQRTKSLLQQVPPQLLAERTTVIGQPDAGDWGGYYVEVRQIGVRRFWLIDTKKSNIPPYLHAFTDSLRVHIQALK